MQTKITNIIYCISQERKLKYQRCVTFLAQLILYFSPVGLSLHVVSYPSVSIAL